jgi:hypothetical protein
MSLRNLKRLIRVKEEYYGKRECIGNFRREDSYGVSEHMKRNKISCKKE